MAKNLLKEREKSNKDYKEKGKSKYVKFAHSSEEEFSKILDFYRIRWEYEPKTFILEYDKYGNPDISFTPDFYLPDMDLYIELTTLNQKLVTKKNHKIKKIKELYPDINIKLFYKKDYHSLLFKYLNR
jgi:hypothetical protein